MEEMGEFLSLLPLLFTGFQTVFIILARKSLYLKQKVICRSFFSIYQCYDFLAFVLCMWFAFNWTRTMLALSFHRRKINRIRIHWPFVTFFLSLHSLKPRFHFTSTRDLRIGERCAIEFIFTVKFYSTNYKEEKLEQCGHLMSFFSTSFPLR